MTALKIDANPDIERLLIAGRRAALAALYDVERSKEIPGSIDVPPESYDGVGDILLISPPSGRPVSLRAGIDAAILEVMVQLGPRGKGTDLPPNLNRPWWKFWA